MTNMAKFEKSYGWTKLLRDAVSLFATLSKTVTSGNVKEYFLQTRQTRQRIRNVTLRRYGACFNIFFGWL